MIDHHQVGRHGLPARKIDMARLGLRALCTQAVVPCRSHQRNHWRTVLQMDQFGEVSESGGLRPQLDLGQTLDRPHIACGQSIPGLRHAMQTQIAASPLEQCHAHRDPQNGHQPRNIALKQLVLQSLGGCGQKHTLTTEQCWNKVSKCFSNTGTGLHHQDATFVQRAGNFQCHLGLPGPRDVRIHRIAQRAICCKGALHRIAQTHASGWLIGVQLPLETGDFVPQCQAFLFETPHHELIHRHMGSGTIDQCIQIAVLHAQFNQPPLGGM